MDLSALKSEVAEIRREMADKVQGDRTAYEQVRYCVWAGQSADGRKHKEALGKDVLPFDGASDVRMRLSDTVVNEAVRQCVAAVTRAMPRTRGMEGSDERLGGKMATILRWLIRSEWRGEFRRQVELAAQYMNADTPAVAVLMVDWEEETGLEEQVLTMDEVLVHVAGQLGEEADVAGLETMLIDPGALEALAGVLGQVLPWMNKRELMRAGRELQKTGEARLVVPYMARSAPWMRALRMMEDVFVPANTTEYQRARVWVLREWLSADEVLERAGRLEWADGFVDEMLGAVGYDGKRAGGHEGESGFMGESEPSARGMGEDDPHRGLYEVLTAWWRETDARGVMGIWKQTFGYHAETAATERELWTVKHGKYPFVAIARECVTARMLDARGLVELTQTEQGSMKMLSDGFEDLTQVTLNPPVKVPPGKPKYQVTLTPFGQVEANAREDVSFMDIPDFPRAATEHRADTRRRVAEYCGRPEEGVEAVVVEMIVQDRVDRFGGGLAEALGMALQLVQERMPDEMLQRIVGGKGLPVARSRAEIQGRFDVYVSFDVRDLNLEFLKLKADLVNVARPWDSRALVSWEKLSARMVEAIDPSWADEAIMEPEEADAREAEEERTNLTKLLSGIRPPRSEGGQNFGLRLKTLEEELQVRMQNPRAFGEPTPAAVALIQEQLEYLRFQAQQQQNAQIGRMGFKPADLATLGEDGESQV